MAVDLLLGRLVVPMGAPRSSGMSIDVPLAAEPRYDDAPQRLNHRHRGRATIVLSPTSMEVELLPGRLVVAMGAPLSSGMSIDVPLSTCCGGAATPVI